MEQRQPDESNESRTDPSPAQSPVSQDPNTPPATTLSSAEPTLAGDREATPRGDAQQTPQQRNNRHQKGRSNGGQRDNRNDRSADAGPRNDRSESRTSTDAGSRNDKPRGGGPESDGQSQRGNAQPNGAPRGETAQHNNRNDGRPNARDRSTDARGRDADNRARDGRDRAGRNPNARDAAFRGADAETDDAADSRDPNGPASQTPDYQGRDERLVIGISLGDYNGIGPEVILKALQYNRLQKLCTPVIYGSMRILNRYRNLLDLKDWNLNGAPTIGQISHKLTNVITCWPDQSQDIQPGQVTPEAGQAALACLQRAVDDLKDGKLDALVTAPINKYNIQSEEFQFPGHTEYLAQQFDVSDNLMFMVSETLRVGVVTGHVPLGHVRQNVTRERIAQKLGLMMQSLKQDFGIEKPKIAVLGLNPHAGEEGLLGNEEQDIIKPLLTDLRNKGQLVFGPYPADGFFGTRNYRNFDAVLAMYHDQGLIPFKAIAFEEGVNFTAGMPVVRTSPDHGTAYDIAGKDLADETSMLQAIYTAIDVARQRKDFLELEAGALKKGVKS